MRVRIGSSDTVISAAEAAQSSARKGTLSTSKKGSSAPKTESRISPICTWPLCTPRLICGIGSSEALVCSWICSLPAAPASASAMNSRRLRVWKLASA